MHALIMPKIMLVGELFPTRPQAGRQAAHHYGALPPGEYRFAVRAINSDGDSSPAAATVEFRVVAAFWRRAWFQAILFFAAIAGTLLVHSARASRRSNQKKSSARGRYF